MKINMTTPVKLLAMIGIALAVGVGTVMAYTNNYFQAQQNDSSGQQSQPVLALDGLRFRDNAADVMHFRTGADWINMGGDDDYLSFALGNDAIHMWTPSPEKSVITFDTYTSGGAEQYYNWETWSSNYIKYTGAGDNSGSMEVRASDVTIKSNTGDVVIQLGN